MTHNTHRAVFLDRDGTINHDFGYISNPDNFELIHGVRAALHLLQEVNFKLFVVSNQSGVGRGIFTKKDLENVTKKMEDELAKGDVIMGDIKYCLHDPKDSCKCRKPSAKLVKDIVKKHHIKLSESYFIGDKMLDVETGKNAGCKTILILPEDDVVNDDQEMPGEDEWISPDFVAEDLCHAVEWILKDSNLLAKLKEAIMKES